MRTQPARFQSEQSEFSRELGVWTGGGITLLSVDSGAGPVRGAGACKGWEAPLPAWVGQSVTVAVLMCLCGRAR